MRVLICGGRTFGVDDGMRTWLDGRCQIPRHILDQFFLDQVLDKIHRRVGITELIHGAAKSADSLAGEWAAARGVPVRVFPADWDRYRRRAPRRP